MIVNIVGCAAEVHRLPYIGTVDIVAGRLAVFLIQPNRTGRRFVRPLNDGQSVFPAKAIRGFSRTLLLCFGIVVLAAIPKGHGVKAEMAVDMLL